MDDNEQRLTIITDDLLTQSVCGSQPMVLLKSETVPANGACLPEQSAFNLSCSCLEGFDANTTTWGFRIRKPDTEPTSPFPSTITAGDVIQVDSLMLLDIPAGLLTFKMQGVDDDLIPVTLKKAQIGDGDLALVRSQDVSSLARVEVSNLDFSAVPIDSGFLPTSLTSLYVTEEVRVSDKCEQILDLTAVFARRLLRNCNLSSLGLPFLESFAGLQLLNLEANKLSSIYKSLPDSAAAMTEIDLSGNAITNLTVTSDDFALISQLAAFAIDSPGGFQSDESSCDGEWQDAHNIKFCVLNGTSSTPTPEVVVTTDSNGDDTNWTVFVLLAALGGCLVGFLLLYLALKMVNISSTRREKLGSSSPSVDEVHTSRAMPLNDTMAFYDSLHPTLNANLLNDPLIQSFRLPYKELRVGRCISKGGFGLVYTGVYKQRRVAIKKIQREKCEKISQIRMFVREITLMGSLKHPRIVEFIGVAWDSLRNLSAVTEYMDRGDLREVLHSFKNQGNEANGFTWLGHKLRIALHIAEGLAYMHSLSPKVIHRDLKSKNVLLNNDYEAKLTDFGVSRERSVNEDGVVPDRFMTPGVGTSFWIAPEVLLGKDYDERADIFSFGVVLSELDTDDYPYWNSGTIPAQNDAEERRTQEQAILEKVALGSLRPTFYNDCPPGVLALAANCLEGRPDNRPSASGVVLAIKDLLHQAKFEDPQQHTPEEIATAGFLSDL
ncbi:hypothetical protein BBJ28_00003259 [Nothophytophthora sp. Chile5]|nr:hypothetical protein BBJ28_00003259 [Nothophytophthora sp. Chile5]